MALERTRGATRRDAIAARRQMAQDLAPHLVTIRDLTDPSAVVANAVGVAVRFGVALEPLRGSVLRALGRAWHCASAPGASGSIEATALDGVTMLVQVHGADWSLIARTGGPALCLFDGTSPAGTLEPPGPPTVIDVSGTDLIGPLVQALVKAAERTHRHARVGSHAVPEQAAAEVVALVAPRRSRRGVDLGDEDTVRWELPRQASHRQRPEPATGGRHSERGIG